MRRTITSEFVGDQPSRFTSLAFEKTAKKTFSRTPIATTLHENVYGIPILINRTPEILALPLNGDKDFVDMPRIAQAALPFFEFSSIVWPKLLAPLPNGLIGHRDAPCGQ